MAEIIGTERDPLLVAIDIACDPTRPVALRLEAALGASKYLHPTLSAAAVQHVPASTDPTRALTALLDRLGRLQAPASGAVIDLAPEPVPAEAAR